MFYKVKFINNNGIYRTVIICDKITQTNLEDSKQIKEDNYEYSNNSIYLDDTIENIKYKIVKSIGIDISVDELYIFATRKVTYTTKELYDILSQNQQLPISQAKYLNYLSNFSEINIDAIEKKDVYTYDDIITLDIDKKEVTEQFAIGIDYNLVSKYPVSINPYMTKFEDELLLQKNNVIISTHNKNILLNYNTLEDTTLYVCLAQELFSLKKTEYYSKIYFPLLAKHKIYTEPELIREREKIKSDIGDERFIRKYNEKIDFLHNIYITREDELPYINKGVDSIEFIIHPNQTTLIPIHTIFRIIETTKERLLVKYNNRKKIEKIFRLYTDKIDSNGEKIPILTKTEIHKISEVLGRKRSVSMYYRFDTTEIMIDLHTNGDIKVLLNSNNTFDISDLETYIKSVLNQLLLDINIVIERSGYKYELFTTLHDRHVEIINLSYRKEILITKPLHFEKYYKCLTNIFTIIEPDLTKGIELDYKRIAYYKLMNDIEKFITRKHLQQYTLEDVVDLVSKNFEISMDESKLKVTEWLQTTEVEQNTFHGRKIKVKNTSGIPIYITKDKYSNKITIKITDIDQLLYLETIPIFIDILLRLSQDIMNERIDRTQLSLLCNDDIKQIKIQKDITPPQEKPFDDRDDVVIDNGKIMFDNQDTDDEDDLLDALMESDDDVDDDNDVDDGDVIFEDLGEIPITPDSDGEGVGANIEDNLGGGGGPKDPPNGDSDTLLTNIDGMSLNNPNYFFERMYKRDPALFLKKPNGKFQPYSRGCPWNYRRHPVILTDKEKKKIDRDYPNSYPKDQVFEYGSSPEKKHWYICPRYWCLRDNVPLSEQDVKDGKCGGKIIPYSAKKVPKGHYIFEFNAGKRNNEHIGKDGGYVQHYPGFLKPDFHPDGKGVPCCFRYWDKGGQTERRNYFLPVGKALTKNKTKGTVSKEETTEQVQDHLKFPLKHSVIGYLPISIQKMLRTNNEECRRKKTDVYLRVSKHTNPPSRQWPCLLREGVENSKNQSFLACLAAYNTKETCNMDCNIMSVKTDIKEKLTIDIFVRLQNGSLVEIFYNKDTKIDVSEFKSSASNTTMNIVYQMEKKNINYVKKIISAYIAFQAYIESNDSLIDHTYLWDFVSSYYFNDETDNHINLIILEIVDDDLTNKVDIICPTSAYSTIKFNTDYKCIIMIKNDSFYEPVCLYKYIEYKESGKKKYKMQMQHNKFSFPNDDSDDDGDDVMDGELKIAIEIIQANQNKCLIKNKVIQYDDSVNVEDIFAKIKGHSEYVCVGQVLNYNNKIIGILIINKEIEQIATDPIFIPIKPSKILDDIEILTIDDDFARDYQTTRDVLGLMGDKLDIPCAPMLKVIEGGAIVGLLTGTNQFVPITPPSENIHDDDIPEKTIEDDIPNNSGLNYNTVDSETIFDESVDDERENAIKKIKLETNFYIAFRNTFRVVLNKLENYKIKQELVDIIDEYNLFINKIKAVEAIIRTLLEPYIVFNILDKSTINMLDKIGLCVDRDQIEEKAQYCFTDDRGDKPKLILPKKHLISKYDNEKIYYGRLADELVRYNKIHNYILKDNTYLNLVEIPYNLHRNEIILLESLMYKEYFKKLTTVGTRSEMRNTYDTIMYQDGVNELVVRNKKDSILEDNENHICPISVRKMAPTDSSHKYLKQMGKIEIATYSKTTHCMFNLFIDIIKDATKKTVTKQHIKTILSKQLNILVQTESDKIRETFISQGKNYLSRKLELHRNIVDLVEDEHYYLTNVDVHILCEHFKISLVIMSKYTSQLLETRNFSEKKLFSVNYSTDTTHYYLIKQASIKIDKLIGGELIPNPQIYDILYLDGKLRFQVKHFSYEFLKLIEANKVTTIFTKKHVKKSRLKSDK